MFNEYIVHFFVFSVSVCGSVLKDFEVDLLRAIGFSVCKVDCIFQGNLPQNLENVVMFHFAKNTQPCARKN